MDAQTSVLGRLEAGAGIQTTSRLKVVDMHTSGQPTRILYAGLPDLPSNLSTFAEKRDYIKNHHDSIRAALMLEPRGHQGMYGAIILPSSDGTPADICQVVFTCASMYTPMCGHATFALGRFLVDYPALIDINSLSRTEAGALPDPQRYKYDTVTKIKSLTIKVPCGVLDVTVPIASSGLSDSSRSVSFVSVPSYAVSDVKIDPEDRVTSGNGKAFLSEADKHVHELPTVKGDLSYGGGWYYLINASQLCIKKGLLDDLTWAREVAIAFTKRLKRVDAVIDIVGRANDGSVNLYGIVITDILPDDSLRAFRDDRCEDGGLGLCIFSDDKLDRSPTGGAVASRVAAAWQHGRLSFGQRRAYHSTTSITLGDSAAFIGSVESECTPDGKPGTGAIRVKVEGKAFYTGTSGFLVEPDDGLGLSGFLIK